MKEGVLGVVGTLSSSISMLSASTCSWFAKSEPFNSEPTGGGSIMSTISSGSRTGLPIFHSSPNNSGWFPDE